MKKVIAMKDLDLFLLLGLENERHIKLTPVFENSVVQLKPNC
jgi:hypothetical protein